MSLMPRHLGATLGIVAAVASIGFIMVRLNEATAPVQTAVTLSSSSPTPVALESLQIEEQQALTRRWTLHAEPGSNGADGLSRDVALRIGRPANIQATLSAPQRTVLTCNLQPRPYGVCAVKVRFVTGANMECEYECKSTGSRQ